MRRRITFFVGIALAVVSAAALAVREPVMLPTGWAISPAQSQVRTVGTMPVGIALSADGASAIVMENGAGPAGARVLDAGTLVQERFIGDRATAAGPWREPRLRGAALGSRVGSAIFDAAGSGLWMVDGGEDRLIHADARTGALDGIVSLGGGAYPDEIASSPDGGELAVADDLAGAVSFVEVTSAAVRGTVAVGSHPKGLLWSRDGRTLYVTLWGGHEVAVVDTATLAVRTTIAVGFHPEAIVGSPDERYLYVANSDDDTLSAIDAASDSVVATVSVGLFDGIVAGVSPANLTLSQDGRRLYVVCPNANAVAVLAVDGASLELLGAIPTGWYPTAMVFDGSDRLLIVDGKGEGSRPNPGYRPLPLSKDVPADHNGYIATSLVGSVRAMTVPSDEALAAGLGVVRRNAGPILTAALGDASVLRDGPPSDDPGRAVVRADSPIHHVIYIIKENRTYDQVLGDLPAGDGDPSLTLFGARITPNQHAIVQRFGLFDRLFADAQVSADGHQWSTAAFANDYVNTMYPPVYGGRRSLYDFEDTAGPARPHNGYLWDAAARAGISYRIYGEFVTNGKTVGAPATSQVQNIAGHIDPRYRGWDIDYRDTERVNEWLREFHAYERSGDLPALEIVRLPNDHTSGTRAGAWTPIAMVADNDAALGRIVDAVSHSQYWKSTAIFSIEDDAQNGPDHVDDQRTTFYLASPYAARGVHHERYSTASVLRTIELILGLPPLSTYDAAALPLYAAFTPVADLRPYDVIAPKVDTRLRNGRDEYRALEASHLNWRNADAIPDALMNDLVWHAVRGARATPPPYGAFLGRWRSSREADE